MTNYCEDDRHALCSDSRCGCICHPVGILPPTKCPPHTPYDLGMTLSGQVTGEIVIRRAQIILCSACHLVYWQELPPVVPGAIVGRNN